MLRKSWLVPAILALIGGIAAAQGTNRADGPVSGANAGQGFHFASIRINGELFGRGEGWSWFQGDTRTRYAYGDSRLQLSFRQSLRTLDWEVELEQPALFDLPNDAIIQVT